MHLDSEFQPLYWLLYMSKGCSTIWEERFLVLGHKLVERVYSLLVQFQVNFFSLFLVLDALGMIHQMLREPWCKLEKGSFIWYLIEMTLMASGVFSRGGFCLIERGRMQVEKEYFGGEDIIISFIQDRGFVDQSGGCSSSLGAFGWNH